MTIYHKHHIIPKHLGGTDDSSNIVEVTVEQHALLHKQLWKDLGHWEDELAWKGLSKMIDKQTLISEMISNVHKGIPKSKEHRKKISEAQTGEKSHFYGGKKHTKEWKEKHSLDMTGEKNPMYGKKGKEHPKFGKNKKWSEESKNNLKNNWKREKIICEICGKSMHKSNFIKWNHGVNCSNN